MAAAAIPLMVGGSVLSAAGTLQKGAAQRQEAEYDAAIQEQNAEISIANAKEQERRFRRQAAKRVGSLKASVGASGISLSGSALDVLFDNMVEDELEAQTIKHEGELKARGYKQSAVLSRARGKQAERSAGLSAAATLLGGAGRVAGAA